MRILFFGDSITDAGRSKEADFNLNSYGLGYVRSVAGTLMCESPDRYEIINRGIGGNRIVDLYARITEGNDTVDMACHNCHIALCGADDHHFCLTVIDQTVGGNYFERKASHAYASLLYASTTSSMLPLYRK